MKVYADADEVKDISIEEGVVFNIPVIVVTRTKKKS